MKGQIKIILTIFTIVVITVVFLFLGRKRLAEIEEIKKRISNVQSMRLQKETPVPIRGEESLFSKKDVPSFIENLHRLAEKNRIERYEVITQSNKYIHAGSSLKTQLQGADIYPLEITLEGSYRDVAEYIRELQNMKKFQKIKEIEIMPDKKLIKAKITLEIYILRGKDAS